MILCELNAAKLRLLPVLVPLPIISSDPELLSAILYLPNVAEPVPAEIVFIPDANEYEPEATVVLP